MDDEVQSPTAAAQTMRRSSSQTSGASANSKKTKSMHDRLQRGPSKSSSISSISHDESLTSFPSLSPDNTTGQNDGSNAEASRIEPRRTTSQRVRDRKKTLASLTSASPSLKDRTSLFDDSPRPSFDIPGALHLVNDDHIERLIARSGAVKLVRQFAQDLAQRDAELSALRGRAHDREKELKKMLRELNVSSATIEKRLHDLELSNSQNESEGSDRPPEFSRKIISRIDQMMQQAMSEEGGLLENQVTSNDETDLSGTVKVPKNADKSPKPSKINPTHSRNVSATGGQKRDGNASPGTSRASSIFDEDVHDGNATAKPRPNSRSKRRGIDGLFQQSAQSSSYFIGGANKTIKKPTTADDASIHSQKSNRSMTSWTRIFGGSSQAGKEDPGRPRSSSIESAKPSDLKKTASAPDSGKSAKARTNPHNISNISRSSTPLSSNAGSKAKPTGRRTPTPSGLSTSPDHVRKDSDSIVVGPVEMDAILPLDSKPPTMTHTTNNYNPEGLLTDRFGFIYDQRQRKRQMLIASSTKLNRLSGIESLSNFRNDSDSDDEATPKAKAAPSKRKNISVPADEDTQPKKWSDYLLVPSKASSARPTELLSHTPSSGAVVTVNTADVIGTITPPRSRAMSIAVTSQQALPSTTITTTSVESNVTASSPRFGNNQNLRTPSSSTPSSAYDKEPVKLLLEQLTDLHDTLQAEREAKFNDFLRKVRAERAATASSDRALNNVPEADIPNGELIGNLGHSKNRNKYLQFKTLVLAGIPVSLRPKIWAECSGATSLRIPGYFDDLLAKSQSGDEMDPEIAQQIAADIGRTLTDNTFFRHGPGTQRLSDILRAYSMHNPSVGYCQGMNLITANLLLICATTEDVFWLLVAIIDKIMPSGYFDRGLRVSRADQVVLRSYVVEVLPKLDAKLEELGVEIEILTFKWFLSMFTAVVSAEALYRIWDVILTLNSAESAAPIPPLVSNLPLITPTIVTATEITTPEHDGTSSPFLVQLALSLLKLNEPALLALESPAGFYQYMNHNMTNHAISIDALIQAAEGLRFKVRREDLLKRRKAALESL